MTDTTTRRTWAPTYPKLAYATGTRCNASKTRTNSGAWTSCVKPAWHDGRHLADIMAAQMMTEEAWVAQQADLAVAAMAAKGGRA